MVTRSSFGGTGGGTAFGLAPVVPPASGEDSAGVVGAGEVCGVSSAMLGTLVRSTGGRARRLPCVDADSPRVLASLTAVLLAAPSLAGAAQAGGATGEVGTAAASGAPSRGHRGADRGRLRDALARGVRPGGHAGRERDHRRPRRGAQSPTATPPRTGPRTSSLAQQRTDQIDAAATPSCRRPTPGARPGWRCCSTARTRWTRPTRPGSTPADGIYILGGDQGLAMKVLAASPAEAAMGRAAASGRRRSVAPAPGRRSVPQHDQRLRRGARAGRRVAAQQHADVVGRRRRPRAWARLRLDRGHLRPALLPARTVRPAAVDHRHQ